LEINHDVKRRIGSMVWTDPVNVLVGFEYGYDKVDNVLFEKFLHDGGRYDHFGYNDRYELTHVTYRSPDPNPPASWRDTFDYDDNYNRKTAAFGDPFEPAPSVMDTYAANAVNEYTGIVRNGQPFVVEHDRAGNMTQFPVRPATVTPQADVQATARWDAFNLMFDIENPATGRQHYRYDPFNRRIAVLESETDLQGSRRFIYHGWSDIEERIFNPGATLASAPSRLERIYVDGPSIDEHLLAAIDRDGDGQLGGANLKNMRAVTADQEYFYLQNRLGSTMALSDADNSERLLEYIRYTAFGETAVLGLVDSDSDYREDTPLDLGDNATVNSRRFSEESGNPFMFTGRHLGAREGLMYYRHRYYEEVSSRFGSRDSLGYVNGVNLLHYVQNNVASHRDPSGLIIFLAVPAWLTVEAVAAGAAVVGTVTTYYLSGCEIGAEKDVVTYEETEVWVLTCAETHQYAPVRRCQRCVHKEYCRRNSLGRADWYVVSGSKTCGPPNLPLPCN